MLRVLFLCPPLFKRGEGGGGVAGSIEVSQDRRWGILVVSSFDTADKR